MFLNDGGYEYNDDDYKRRWPKRVAVVVVVLLVAGAAVWLFAANTPNRRAAIPAGVPAASSQLSPTASTDALTLPTDAASRYTLGWICSPGATALRYSNMSPIVKYGLMILCRSIAIVRAACLYFVDNFSAHSRFKCRFCG